MYSKMFEGKKIRINNRHRKLLLKRFDSNKFELRTVRDHSNDSMPSLMRNGERCALCKSYFKGRRLVPHCGKCPLRKFETEDSNQGHRLGCSYILDRLVPAGYVTMNTGSVAYWCKDSNPALKELKVITDFLNSFEKE